MILFEGPSLIDSSPIVVIAVEDENPKTGKMLFTWILRADRPPEVAAYDGSDEAICGDCKFRAQPKLSSVLRPEFTRTCYVRLGDDADEKLSPSEVWRKWKAGEFPHVTDPWEVWNEDRQWTCFDVEGRVGQWTHHPVYLGPLPVRIGSYGDPAAVSTRVWEELVKYAKHWTGYTHLWKPLTCAWCDGVGIVGWHEGEEYANCPDCIEGAIDRCDPDLKKYCMASVDTPEERDEAQALGWRTFTVVPEESQEQFEENNAWKWPVEDILCPATQGKSVCAKCRLCMGTSSKASKSIFEIVHGKNKENHQWSL